MCIIVNSKRGELPPKDKLHTAYVNNPHGCGIMWADQGEVKVTQGVWKFDQIWEHLEALEGTPYAMHRRWVTRGKLGDAQCHPFRLTEKSLQGRDIWMMHNGTMFFLNNEVKKFNDRKSDTQIFAGHLAEVLRGQSDPEILFSDDVQDKMKSSMGGHNRLLFMTDEGKTHILNRSQGVEDSEFWYSNDYSFEKGYRVNQAITKSWIKSGWNKDNLSADSLSSYNHAKGDKRRKLLSSGSSKKKKKTHVAYVIGRRAAFPDAPLDYYVD